MRWTALHPAGSICFRPNMEESTLNGSFEASFLPIDRRSWNVRNALRLRSLKGSYRQRARPINFLTG